MTAEEINKHALSAIEKYPKAVEDYKKGKTGLIGLFLGEVIKTTEHEADPIIATKLIENHLNNM